VQGIEPGGQLTITTEVENWPGDTEVQGPDLMVRMEAHAKAMGTEIISTIITELDLSKPPLPRRGRQRHGLHRRRGDPGHRRAGEVAGPAVEEKRSRASASRPAPPATGSSTAARRSW
jgi:hypothetical protein